MKLSKAQQKVWDEINDPEIRNPDANIRHKNAWHPEKDWTKNYKYGSHTWSNTWYAKFVYGRYNTATLKVLEKKGLIKVHEFGGAHYDDIIEIL